MINTQKSSIRRNKMDAKRNIFIVYTTHLFYDVHSSIPIVYFILEIQYLTILYHNKNYDRQKIFRCNNKNLQGLERVIYKI